MCVCVFSIVALIKRRYLLWKTGHGHFIINIIEIEIQVITTINNIIYKKRKINNTNYDNESFKRKQN